MIYPKPYSIYLRGTIAAYQLGAMSSSCKQGQGQIRITTTIMESLRTKEILRDSLGLVGV